MWEDYEVRLNAYGLVTRRGGSTRLLGDGLCVAQTITKKAGMVSAYYRHCVSCVKQRYRRGEAKVWYIIQRFAYIVVRWKHIRVLRQRSGARRMVLKRIAWCWLKPHQEEHERY